MERLILKYSVGDGYTYSADILEPIIYSSKQEAIDDFTLIILQYFDDIKIYEKAEEKLENQKQQLFNKLTHLTNTSKNNDLINETNTKYSQIYHEFSEFEKTKPIEFLFGGAKFEYQHFFIYYSDTKERELDLPNIFTLDYFFEEVEKNVKESNTNTQINTQSVLKNRL